MSCDITFKNGTFLAKHLHNKHKRKVKCDHCAYISFDQETLDNHVKSCEFNMDQEEEPEISQIVSPIVSNKESLVHSTPLIKDSGSSASKKNQGQVGINESVANDKVTSPTIIKLLAPKRRSLRSRSKDNQEEESQKSINEDLAKSKQKRRVSFAEPSTSNTLSSAKYKPGPKSKKIKLLQTEQSDDDFITNDQDDVAYNDTSYDDAPYNDAFDDHFEGAFDDPVDEEKPENETDLSSYSKRPRRKSSIKAIEKYKSGEKSLDLIDDDKIDENGKSEPKDLDFDPDNMDPVPEKKEKVPGRKRGRPRMFHGPITKYQIQAKEKRLLQKQADEIDDNENDQKDEEMDDNESNLCSTPKKSRHENASKTLDTNDIGDESFDFNDVGETIFDDDEEDDETEVKNTFKDETSGSIDKTGKFWFQTYVKKKRKKIWGQEIIENRFLSNAVQYYFLDLVYLIFTGNTAATPFPPDLLPQLTKGYLCLLLPNTYLC